MGKRVGTLIKEARTNAGLTQEQLARKVKGVTASDISLAERAKKDLTNEELKLIAKATGVTQKSLLDAAKLDGGKKPTTSSSSSASSSAAKSSMQVTATERKLVELYRAADSKTRKAATDVLKGNTTTADNIFSSILSNALSGIGTKEMPDGEANEESAHANVAEKEPRLPEDGVIHLGDA